MIKGKRVWNNILDSYIIMRTCNQYLLRILVHLYLDSLLFYFLKIGIKREFKRSRLSLKISQWLLMNQWFFGRSMFWNTMVQNTWGLLVLKCHYISIYFLTCSHLWYLFLLDVYGYFWMWRKKWFLSVQPFQENF